MLECVPNIAKKLGTQSMQLQVLRLNPKADYRLKNGHLWIYSNEVNNEYNPIKNFTPGEQAVIENSAGKELGIAYINPNTLICGRLISRDIAKPLTLNKIKQHIKNAFDLRNELFPNNCYRLIYGESDFLPGLVVDRFNDLLVVQLSTAGMEQFIDQIIAALSEIINPKAILLKNDGKMREVEGLDSYVRWVLGSEQDSAELTENNVKFIAPLLQGQKTGWFYDHRMSRARLNNYVKNKRVLDVFSYVGGWGIQAAVNGAREVVFTDISELALKYVQKNAQLNNANNIKTIQGDAFDVMEKLHAAGEKFDVVIIDPPAFIPRRKDLAKGVAAYQKANLFAVRLLNENGVIFSSSCSMHLPVAELRSAIQRAGQKLGKNVQILEQGHQGPDHPIHPAIPETEYIKTIVARIC